MCSLEQNILTSLFSSGSAPGILYGLPKIHRPDYPSAILLSGRRNYRADKEMTSST